jgi:hypothetical protein
MAALMFIVLAVLIRGQLLAEVGEVLEVRDPTGSGCWLGRRGQVRARCLKSGVDGAPVVSLRAGAATFAHTLV